MTLPMSEIEALIKLLDDSDQAIYSKVTKELINCGPPVIPILEHAWEGSFEPLLQKRLELIIHDIRFKGLKLEFSDWCNQNQQKELLDAWLIINRYFYPEINLDAIREKINQIRRDIWIELNNNLSPVEEIHVFNQVFYKLLGFKGLTTQSANPSNYLINTLLDTRQGLPLPMGMLYLIIAQQLNLPVYGADIPGHFALAYTQNFISDWKKSETSLRTEVIFFINPVNTGIIFTKFEIDEYLQKINLEKENRFFEPLANIQTLQLLLAKLLSLLKDQHKENEASEIAELKSLLTEDKHG